MRLKLIAEGPTETVEGRTRGDVCRLQALHGAALIAREMGMEAAFEDSVFLAAHDSYVDTLSDLEDKFIIETELLTSHSRYNCSFSDFVQC